VVYWTEISSEHVIRFNASPPE